MSLCPALDIHHIGFDTRESVRRRAEKIMRTLVGVVAAAALLVQPATGTAETGANATAANLVATQVREQGFECREPVSAEREPPLDGDAVWILTCSNVTYRVRLVPDMAAHIETID